VHLHHGSPLCPSFQCEPEDAWHFLKCAHLERKALFQTLKNSLTHVTQKLQLHPCVLTAIWMGLAAIQNDIAYPDILNDTLQPLRQCIQCQTRLGWDQLYHGCLSIDWAKAIEIIHPNLQQSGAQVMVSMTQTIWSYILDFWKLQNQHLHKVAN